jgi:hypothetical protein
MQSLTEVEHICTHPRGLRKVLHVTLVTLANFLPEIVLVGAFIRLIWLYSMVDTARIALTDLLIPFALTLVVLVLLQMLTAVLLPMRWSAVRDEFDQQLTTHIDEILQRVYGSIPNDTANALLSERAMVEELLTNVREVRTWLAERQSAVTVAGLYGN